MGGMSKPGPELQAEIWRIKDKLLDAVEDETNFVAMAQASLLIWARIVSLDPEVTQEQAKSVASAAIERHIKGRSC